MKICISGGKAKADFLIGSLLKKNHTLTVINDDSTYCNYLANTHNIPIIMGDPCKKYVLDDAEIHNYDVIIALRPNDPDNLEICQMAKQLYHVKKTVCIVSNPKNVDVFKKLGVNTVISATYIVANMIEQASVIEDLVKTLSIDDEKVILTELAIDASYPVCNKKIKDITIPPNIIISCIIRRSDMIVPNGSTVILKGDKLLIISSPQNQESVIRTISGERRL